MKLRVSLFVFCAALYVGASDPGPGGNKKSPSIRLELLLAKLEAMEQKLQEMQNEFKQYQSKQEQSQKKTFNALKKLDQDVVLVLQNRSCHNFTQQIVSVLPKQNQSAHNSAPQILDHVPLTSTTTLRPRHTHFSSCKDISSRISISDTHLIRVKNDSEPFKVYCEQKSFGGGWIVIQHRYNGSLDFYRGWDEFRDGFGDLDREFWLGLEKVHQITKGRKHELIVELKGFDGSYAYARYDAFEVGNESEQYILKDLGSYSGTAGDAMTYNKGMKFTTKDRDNDLDPSMQCAHYREGAWWHNACTDANLNGRYVNADDQKSLCWAYFKNIFQGLSFSRMMIRELE
ncbi:fibrinogen and fibronectin [Anopheles darlingi]|uniref:Fibrinogen and fibronectin n=1 Tax=Anopheles darlingi TaxID=43151 RepID=W5JSN8_ANODA|nr:fibrinogen and fibronectin [Anopheles darlingi]